MKYALCVKLCQHNFTIVIVHKLLVHGHCSESGLNSLPSRSSRCPRVRLYAGLSLQRFLAFRRPWTTMSWTKSIYLAISRPLLVVNAKKWKELTCAAPCLATVKPPPVRCRYAASAGAALIEVIRTSILHLICLTMRFTSSQNIIKQRTSGNAPRLKYLMSN